MLSLSYRSVAPLCPFVILLCACTAFAPKLPGAAPLADEHGVRQVVQRSAAEFSGQLTDAEDRVGQSPAAAGHLTATRWVKDAHCAIDRAISQDTATASVLEMWALSVELSRFLQQDSAAAQLGAERQGLQDAAEKLNTQMVEAAKSILSRHDFSRWQQWINRYADDLRAGDGECMGLSVRQLWWSQNSHRVALMETAGSHAR